MADEQTSATPVDPITLKFGFEKETQNTFRYKEVVEGEDKPIVGSLYVRKDIAADRKELTVTIS
jgi:hypothetical protein